MTKIALLVLDTLRKDTFDEHFDWLPGIRFENAWSTSHWTVPAHASLFTGQYPSVAGVYARSQSLNYENPVLAEALQQAGVQTHGFSANPHIAPDFEFDRGFDLFKRPLRGRIKDDDLFSWREFLDQSELPFPPNALAAVVECIRGDYDTTASVRKAVRWIRLNHHIGSSVVDDGASEALRTIRKTHFEDDAFLFVNLMEAHAPYLAPEKYRSREYADEEVMNLGLSETISGKAIDPGPTKQAYEDCVYYLSDVYQSIFDELDDFDYIITLSDHGELFGEHGIWAHSYGVSPELTHIPIVVTGPDRDEHVSRRLTNLLDVHRTILDLAGADAPSGGYPLFDTPSRRESVTEYHGFTHTSKMEKLRENGIEAEEIEKYDEPRYGIALPPSYYGYETLDGFASRGKSKRSDPLQWLKRSKENAEPLERGETVVDDRVKDQLSRLGYI